MNKLVDDIYKELKEDFGIDVDKNKIKDIIKKHKKQETDDIKRDVILDIWENL